jgi:hypothetical protein
LYNKIDLSENEIESLKLFTTQILLALSTDVKDSNGNSVEKLHQKAEESLINVLFPAIISFEKYFDTDNDIWEMLKNAINTSSKNKVKRVVMISLLPNNSVLDFKIDDDYYEQFKTADEFFKSLNGHPLYKACSNQLNGEIFKKYFLKSVIITIHKFFVTFKEFP